MDRRNRDLLWLAEDVLRHLERQAIFGDRIVITVEGKIVPFGILWRQIIQDRVRKRAIRIRWRGKSCIPLFIFLDAIWRGKHRYWLPIVSCSIGVLFFLAGALILIQPSFLKPIPAPAVGPPHSSHKVRA